MAINILDSLIINRISAGEVVESPFSIVKELIDNSLDAGATNITVEIKGGGIDYISIKDNGKGIEKDDIIKAFLPHATSKIKTVEDLEKISTLGFRGEALASISNVSQTMIETKTKDSEFAYKLEVNGGEFGEVEISTASNGTKIQVRNLFFNTPVRRKFLKKTKQEEAQITNVMTRYILANPTISFKYIVDDIVIYQNNDKSLLGAISCVYGSEITPYLDEVESRIDNIHIKGYVSRIGFSKPNTTYQTLVLNGRYIVDEIVSKAVYMAMEEYLMPRQFPMYVLFLTMPEIDVDVNVHPSKMNVKFAKPNKIYDLVYSTIRSSIYKQINPTSTQVRTQTESDYLSEIIKPDLNCLNEVEVEPLSNVSNITTKVSLKQETYSPITIFDLKREEEKKKSADAVQMVQPSIADNQNKLEDIKSSIVPQKANLVEIENLPDYKIIGEIFNEFIVLEQNDNMLLLDFHAGHERLNYDKFLKIVQNREIIIQDLLVPYTQNLTEVEVEYINDLHDDLLELGFDISQMSDRTIAVNAVPMQLKDINLKTFIDDLIHDLKNKKPIINNEIRHYLMQKACKSSVKSGMKLSEHEINELLKNISKENPVLLCPHGRPIITVVSKSQIEKWFKRIV